MALAHLIFFEFFDGASTVEAPVAPAVIVRSGVSKSRYLRRHLKGYDPEPESIEPVVVERRKKNLKIPKIELEAINDALGPLGPVKAVTLEHEVKFGPKVGEHKLAEVDDDDEDFLLMSVL